MFNLRILSSLIKGDLICENRQTAANKQALTDVQVLEKQITW